MCGTIKQTHTHKITKGYTVQFYVVHYNNEKSMGGTFLQNIRNQ